MPEWDNSRAPQIGDRRVGVGCASIFIFCFFSAIALVLGFIEWLGKWIGG